MGLAFAQVVTAGHACPMLGRASPSLAQVAQTMPADCPQMAKQAGSTINVCVGHCFADEQVDAPANVPAALVAPQPALRVHLPDIPVATVVVARLLPPSPSAAPPPQLRFSRFLI